MRALSCASVAALVAIYAAPAAAVDVLRCGNSLVRAGMTAGEVTAKCGEPSAKEVIPVPVQVRRPNGTVQVVGTTYTELWTYDRASGQFPAQLTFEEGSLKRIELLTGR